MLKPDIITAMAEKTEGTKVAAEKHLNAFLEVLEDCARAGEPVKLNGYFTMETVDRAEKNGYNLQTKEKVVYPASKGLKMKAGATLKALAKQ